MKHTKLLTFAIAALFAGSAMAETELFSTDFSSADWTDHVSICESKTKAETVNGIYFYSDNDSKYYSIADGVLTFANNNMSNKYYIAIAIQNVNHVIDVTIGTAANGQRISYGFVEADASTVPSYPSSITNTQSSDNTNSEIRLSYNMAGTGTSAWIFIGRQGSGFSSVIKTIKVTTMAKDDATLKSIAVNGEEIADFDPDTLAYTVELPYGTKDYPTVTAVCTSSKATYTAGTVVRVDQNWQFPAKQVILVHAEDGSTTKEYELTYTVKAEANHDASASAITLKGLTINNPKTDTLYSLTYEYLTTIPTKEDLKVTFNDEYASVYAIDNCVEWGKTYTITTVAQDQTTKNTYRIQLFCESAPKHIYEVLFSNGAKGAINEEDTVITVPYLAGEAVPTTTVADIKTDSTKIGDTYHYCTAMIDAESNIIVTGEDNTTLKFPVKGYELAAPTTLGTDTVKFDGTEISYIYAAYGYDTEKGKGWKFAKKVNDSNRRISKGTTRIYMVMPAADSLTLISGTGGRRDIKLYVNGVENTEVTETAAAGNGIKFKLNDTKTNFICIESNQTSGDGGFTALILTPTKGTPSGIDNTSAETKAIKVIRNGQLYILKGNKIYNALGTVVE